MPLTPNLPTQVETPRLRLRPPTPNDAAALLQAVTASLPALKEWMAWATDAYGMAEAVAFCNWKSVAGTSSGTPTELPLLITRKADGALVGGSGYHNILWPASRFEIGYWLRTDCTGSGYATEAARALTRFAFDALGARRVEIRMDARNRRSWAVAERLGFAWQGNHAARRDDNAGRRRETRIYALEEPPRCADRNAPTGGSG